jgi:hypothetical protein
MRIITFIFGGALHYVSKSRLGINELPQTRVWVDLKTRFSNISKLLTEVELERIAIPCY